MLGIKIFTKIILYDLKDAEHWKRNDKIIKSILTSIDNYNQDIDTIDDYPYFRGYIYLNLVQNMCKFIPKLNVVSEIFSERQLREVNFIVTPVTCQFAILSSV